MNKYLLTVFFSFKIALTVFSQENPKFYYNTYLTTENLDWSISGNVLGKNPNVYSELIFNNIISFGQTISFEYNPISRLGVAITFKKQQAFSGKGKDTDYASDNRTDIFSNLKFTSKKGGGQKMDFQIYYKLISNRNVAADLGLSYLLHRQTFYLNSDEIQDLNSTYKINPVKYGILVKVGANFFKNIESVVDLKLNKLDYSAEADWNLIQGLHHPISFIHKASGYNLAVTLQNKITINHRILLVFEYGKSIDYYEKGLDILYLRSQTEKYTKFNGGKLNSDLLGLGFIYRL